MDDRDAEGGEGRATVLARAGEFLRSVLLGCRALVTSSGVRTGPGSGRTPGTALAVSRQAGWNAHPVALLATSIAAGFGSVAVWLLQPESPYPPFMAALAAICLAVCLSDRWSDRQWLRELARYRSDHADPSCVGPMVDALEWADRTTRPAVIAALTPLRAEELALLDAHKRTVLYRQLDPRRQHEDRFQVALLSAVAGIGDTSALPYVEAMARGERHTVLERAEIERLAAQHPEVRAALARWDAAYAACHWERRKEPGEGAARNLQEARKALDTAVASAGVPVRQAAQECLNRLRECQAERQATGHLLRAAEAPTTGNLLRPAANPLATEPEALLRPARQDGDTATS